MAHEAPFAILPHPLSRRIQSVGGVLQAPRIYRLLQGPVRDLGDRGLHVYDPCQCWMHGHDRLEDMVKAHASSAGLTVYKAY